MKLTSTSREILRCRRARRDLERAGYEEVGERGGKLWELYRGCRMGHRIVDAKVGPDGISVFVRVVSG